MQGIQDTTITSITPLDCSRCRSAPFRSCTPTRVVTIAGLSRQRLVCPMVHRGMTMEGG